MIVWHLVCVFYAWPNGLVWSNILAEPLIVTGTLACAWPFRHRLMARFVAFHHFHKQLHAQKLSDAPESPESTSAR